MQPLISDPAVEAIVHLALAEDQVDADITSLCLVPSTARGVGRVVARAPGRIAGLALLDVSGPFRNAYPDLTFHCQVPEGSDVERGAVLATLTGSARDLLGIERTLLNFLQRLSGIATATLAYVEAARGTRARIQETRKTCPGLRALDKYAVSVGGGLNHRQHLGDQVLIKENHLVFAGRARSPESVREGVQRARAQTDLAIEVEVENLEQFDAALDAGVDIIMLDDFDPADIREAVRRRDIVGPPPPLLEVSGGVTLERVRELASLGVDRISVGALTHSVKALDLAMDIEPA
ncbi:MAG TPA: carboxylating nicotinate-nucleotide diphosphorylase [Planctomycetota bacterium]|nr:carboxylating nicotinate-nucleotide diphosphorylase [Planctomycetota bacterium]